MIDPIRSGSVPVPQKPLTTPPPQPVAATVPQQPSTTPVQASAQLPAQDRTPRLSDEVDISNEAQARSLRQQGMSIPEIALQLRLDLQRSTGFFPRTRDPNRPKSKARIARAFLFADTPLPRPYSWARRSRPFMNISLRPPRRSRKNRRSKASIIGTALSTRDVPTAVI